MTQLVKEVVQWLIIPEIGQDESNLADRANLPVVLFNSEGERFEILSVYEAGGKLCIDIGEVYDYIGEKKEAGGNISEGNCSPDAAPPEGVA